ncbi:inositol monophosphatase family protein [Alterisphingorhabdus coralli]|uniref:Inositol monophosphatase family protein n=1 Tax=Alterisphingorhabdus coralli TaxID=3071408 RepID=A0AA97F7A1_9SPHN|nr:inositol monophosphatase family protein [Parasphingorhabdus sp. SCSIO 66989]WOE75241.1 inositol monophosphatase family protein [Parasphingorhabdus sp. SCSIO 66989]
MPGIDRASLADVLKQAGALAMQGFDPGRTGSGWEKAPNQPVTESDIAVDRFLRDALGDLDPHAGWLSEESHARPAEGRGAGVWIVDPIDGTRDFIRGRPGWALSVAYCVDGQPQLGALYAPARAELWLAEAGSGAQRNGKTIIASRQEALIGARVPTAQLAKVDRALVAVDKPNSIALRMAMVAADEADLVATLRWGHAWDVAAALLIAQESGALCTDALGKAMDFKDSDAPIFGLLCSAKGIHQAARAHLESRAQTVLDSHPHGLSAAAMRRHEDSDRV